MALMVVAFLTVGALLGASVLRGLASLALGLFIGMIGIDDSTAQQRFTFDNPTLVDGIDMVLVAVGLFALGEALYVASKLRHGPVEVIPVSKGKNAWLSKEDWKRSWKPWLRGTFIGFPIGTVPAGGADVSTFLSYAAERKLAKGAEQGTVRQGRHRGRRRSGSGEQRRGRRRPGPAADARNPDDGDRGHDAHRVPALPDPARTAPVREPGRAGVDPDRLAVRRQPDAAGAEPAAGRACG